MTHVRSWDTDVPVGRTKHAFEDLLKRYGASGFTVSEDYASRTVVIAFSIRVTGQEPAEIRLPVSYNTVLRRLRQMPDFVKRATGKRVRNPEWEEEQAARVAWRHLLLWAESALSIVDSGVYTLQEAFFAHTMIPTPGGGSMPAVDAVNTMRRLSGGGGQ